MSRKMNIAIFALLFVCIVTIAYAPNLGEKTKPGIDPKYTDMSKKLDRLIEVTEANSKKLDEAAEKLVKLDKLIRSRVR